MLTCTYIREELCVHGGKSCLHQSQWQYSHWPWQGRVSASLCMWWDTMQAFRQDAGSFTCHVMASRACYQCTEIQMGSKSSSPSQALSASSSTWLCCPVCLHHIWAAAPWSAWEIWDHPQALTWAITLVIIFKLPVLMLIMVLFHWFFSFFLNCFEFVQFKALFSGDMDGNIRSQHCEHKSCFLVCLL